MSEVKEKVETVQGGDANAYKTIYNFTIIPIPNEEDPLNIDFDLFYFDAKSPKLHLLRIVNAYLSFMLCKLPGLTLNQTLNWIKIKAKKYPEGHFQYKIRCDLRDSAFCVFDHYIEYIEIFSRSPSMLANLKNDMENELRNDYYKHLRKSDLNGWDRIFLEQTESPFRYTQFTTTVQNSKYWLSGKFNIPITGYVEINTKCLKKYQGDYLRPLSSRVEDMNICIANPLNQFENKGILETFREVKLVEDYSNPEMDNIIVASYDIETYVRDANPDPEADDQPVFCVGISFFKISNETPFKRYCILADDLAKDPEIKSKLIPTKSGTIPETWLETSAESKESKEEETIELEGGNSKEEYKPMLKFAREYLVQNEYKDEAKANEKGEIVYKHGDQDETTYICLKREDKQVELRIMLAFINILMKHNPHIILGFNNYLFDDVAMWHRMKRKDEIGWKFIQLFSPYNIRELMSGDDKFIQDAKRHMLPTFRKFPLKMEGKVQNSDNQTVRSYLVQSMDAYKILLKADAKRFSQDGRLNTMLAFYNIKNPFTDQSLSKFKLDKVEIVDKNGETHIETDNYQIMFHCWDHSEQLYQIAKYCCQDAWITGTLLIARAGILDKLAMATTTFTSFEDSIFLADGHRVSCLNSHFGYLAGFAVMDSPDKQREDKRNDPSIRALGEKYFCRCKIVGGAVRNVHAYRALAIVAGDYSAQYPNNWIANNIDSSARVPRYVIEHPKDFNLEIVHTVKIEDTYGSRIVRYVKNIGEDNTFDVKLRHKSEVGLK